MYRLAFSMRHRGCWAVELTERFPGVTCVLRSSLPMRGKARYVLSAQPMGAQAAEAARQRLAAHPDVERCELLELHGDTASFVLDGEWERSVSGEIMARGGFLLAPTVVEAGRERWEVGLARREEGQAIVEAVSALGDDLVVEAIVRDTLADLRLSEGQSRVLRAAINGGYYEFPRRTSPTKLAKQLGLAKSTVIEHLHKAEAKVILAHERDG